MRAGNGRPRLNKNEKLMEIADIRVEEISVNFSHVRPNGCYLGGYGDEYDTGEFSFRENIAGPGATTAKLAFNTWKNSPGHNSTILLKIM